MQIECNGWVEISYTLTREEWQEALNHIQRKASLPRLIVQSVLLALLVAYCIIPAIAAGETGSLFVGVAAVCLLIAQWVAPLIIVRRQAAERAEENKTLRLWLSDSAATVGSGETRVQRTFEEARGQWQQKGELLYWRIDGDTVFPVPRRVLTEEQVRALLG